MKGLDKIKQLPLEIAYCLGQDQILQQLLVNDDSAAAIDSSFSYLDVNDLLSEEYISLAPKLENGMINIKRNTFLIINITDFDFFNINNNIQIEGEILIGTNYSHVMLKNNQNRLLELVDRCLIDLQDKKFSISGILTIDRANTITISENTFGYRLHFTINEQQNERAEI